VSGPRCLSFSHVFGGAIQAELFPWRRTAKAHMAGLNHVLAAHPELDADRDSAHSNLENKPVSRPAVLERDAPGGLAAQVPE
jgi:hypothetical protein